MNSQQPNQKLTLRVRSIQKSSALVLYSEQEAMMNSTPVTSRDPTAPAVARKRGRPKRPRVQKNSKPLLPSQSLNRIDTDDSSISVSCGDRPYNISRKKDRYGRPLMDTRPSSIFRSSTADDKMHVPYPSSNTLHKAILHSSSRDMIALTAAPNNTSHRASQNLSSGGNITPRVTMSATPSASRDNTSVQVASLRSGSRIAPVTLPRVQKILDDATEALKQELTRAKAGAGISNSQADTPMQAIPLQRSGFTIVQATLPPATPHMTAAKRRALDKELIVARAQANSSSLSTPQGLVQDLAYLASLERAFQDAAFYQPGFHQQAVDLASLERAFQDAAFYKPGIHQQDASVPHAAFQQEGVQNRYFEPHASQPEALHQSSLLSQGANQPSHALIEQNDHPQQLGVSRENHYRKPSFDRLTLQNDRRTLRSQSTPVKSCQKRRTQRASAAEQENAFQGQMYSRQKSATKQRHASQPQGYVREEFGVNEQFGPQREVGLHQHYRLEQTHTFGQPQGLNQYHGLAREQTSEKQQGFYQYHGIAQEHPLGQPQAYNQYNALPQDQAFDQQGLHQQGYHQQDFDWPASYRHQEFPQEQGSGRQQGFYQHHGYPQTQPFDQEPQASQQQLANPMPQPNVDQAQRERDELLRWKQSLWNDGGMM